MEFINSFPNKPWFLHVCCTKSFENTVGKGEIARNEQFLFFPQCFLPFFENFMPFSSNMKLTSANSFSLEESKICRLIKCICTTFGSKIPKKYRYISNKIMAKLMFNPFPNKPRFLRVCSTSLLKTLGEKEKLLVTRNFSYFPVFSTHSKSFLPLSSYLKLSSANSFSLEQSKICRLGKG